MLDLPLLEEDTLTEKDTPWVVSFFISNPLMILNKTVDYKTFIYLNFSQADIYYYYYSLISTIGRTEIHKAIEYGQAYAIPNPLREDKHPSLRFTISDDQFKTIRTRDFARPDYNGDVFDFVKKVLGYNSSFENLCAKIIVDMQKFYEKNERLYPNIYELDDSPVLLEFEEREINKVDIDYWGDRLITPHDLKRHNVVPVYNAYVNKYTFYTYTYKDPCYAFLYGIEAGVLKAEFYRPKAAKKEKHSTNVISPIRNLRSVKVTDILILVKSGKEMLVVEKLVTLILNQYQLNISFCILITGSEAIRLNIKAKTAMNSLYKKVFIIGDNDMPGKRYLAFHRKYDFIPISVPRIPIKSKKTGSYITPKDVDEYVVHENFQTILKISKNLINFL